MPKSKKQCQEIRDTMRATILQKSLLYFARNGFSGTKISDLARNIGIGQGTIYVYFESKEDLYKEIFAIANYEEELKKMEFLIKLPIPAKEKMKQLSKTIIRQLKEDETFASKIVLNTQLILEQSNKASSIDTSYQTKLYELTEKIIKQGQKEKVVVDTSTMKLTDYYRSIVYTYALKRLFTSDFEFITAEDLNRSVLI
ncbi:MAG: TetR/AcrR family transcriptional regulator [Clostridium sp.]|nr:TetR/AcrR family transcriptional regulator [Clostridium sp.]